MAAIHKINFFNTNMEEVIGDRATENLSPMVGADGRVYIQREQGTYEEAAYLTPYIDSAELQRMTQIIH